MGSLGSNHMLRNFAFMFNLGSPYVPFAHLCSACVLFMFCLCSIYIAFAHAMFHSRSNSVQFVFHIYSLYGPRLSLMFHSCSIYVLSLLCFCSISVPFVNAYSSYAQFMFISFPRIFHLCSMRVLVWREEGKKEREQRGKRLGR